MVVSIYGGAPSLDRFALEELVLAGGNAKIRGDLGQMPDPLPERWTERGYTRTQATFNAYDVDEAEISGTPRFHFDVRHCLEGDPVDLSVERVSRNWTAPDGTERPYVALSGRSDFFAFRLVCVGLRVEVKGYKPAPY